MPTAAMPGVRDWILRVEESILAAQEGRSAIVPQVLAVPGMTSPRVKHFLNNVCRGTHIVYLEIGSWQGATITAASCGNTGRFTAVENFSQGGMAEFEANRKGTAEWCRFGLVEGDCWKTPAEQIANLDSVNVYFYDGPHRFPNQVDAFTCFDPVFSREFVAVVDDWDHPPVRKGTRVAFDRLGYEIVTDWELPARFNGDAETWWNGLYVAVVRRPATSPVPRPTPPSDRVPTTNGTRPASDGGGAPAVRTDLAASSGGDMAEAPAIRQRLQFRNPSRGPAAGPRAASSARLTAAIVIPCHNYAHWLPEAIESALAQTHRPAEIVVVDDSCDDDSARVAARFAPQGVRCIKIEARSVWEARKAGYRATTADVLCFLDADDRLAPDYLERGLPLFNSGRIGVVYSDFEQFGETEGRSNHPPYERAKLELDNFMHAGSLVLRRAVEVARGFDAPRPNNSHADWFLWRRLAEAGFTAVKQPALYFYRRHGGSMIIDTAHRKVSHYEFADLRYQPVTIVSPLSGRAWAWDRYRDWLERQTWPRSQCTLLVIDSGATSGVRQWLAGSGYPDARYLTFDAGRPGLADLPRGANADEVRLAMSRIYNRVARAIEAPFAFILEDDVIPPPDVIDRLMRAMSKRTAAVTGAYRSRFVAGHVAWKEPGRHLIDGEGVEEIAGCGFGCLLIRRAALQGETFTQLPGEHPDFDIAFFLRLQAAGWQTRIDWGTRAEHLMPPAADLRAEGGSPTTAAHAPAFSARAHSIVRPGSNAAR